jgi:hypothetical protein
MPPLIADGEDAAEQSEDANGGAAIRLPAVVPIPRAPERPHGAAELVGPEKRDVFAPITTANVAAVPNATVGANNDAEEAKEPLGAELERRAAGVRSDDDASESISSEVEERDDICFEFPCAVPNFSKLTVNRWESRTFTYRRHSWNVVVFPKGCQNPNSVAVFINLLTHPQNSMRTWFSIQAVPKKDKGEPKSQEDTYDFTAKSDRGFHDVAPLSELEDRFLENDTLHVSRYHRRASPRVRKMTPTPSRRSWCACSSKATWLACGAARMPRMWRR